MSDAAPDSAALDALWSRIESRMGLRPGFFALASADPPIANALFDLASLAWLDAPLPPRLRESLLTHLSRFCVSRYCITRHAAFLLGRGGAGDDAWPEPLALDQVMSLLDEPPVPDDDELRAQLAALETEPAPLEAWPDFDSRLARPFRIACAEVFRDPERAGAWIAALRRLLGPRRYAQLAWFLAFVRLAHFWTGVHPELRLDPDVEALLREHEALADELLDTREALSRRAETPRERERRDLRRTAAIAEALHESEERWKLALEMSDAGAWELDLGDHTISWRSPNLDVLFGYEEPLPAWSYESFLAHVLEPDRERVDADFRRAVAGQDAWSFDCRIRRHDGEVAWIRVRGRARYDAHGVPVRMWGIVEDVTAAHEAEQALAAAKQRLEATLTATEVGVWRWDVRRDRVVGDRNLARLFGGTTQEEAPLDFFLERIHPADRERVAASIRRVVETGGDYDEEYRVVWPDGIVRWLHARGRLDKRDGETLAFPGVVLDVTERRQSEEQLREADRRKDDFLALLAHELRNPLAPIRTGVELMKLGGMRDPELVASRDMIDRQSQHLQRLLDDLLDISRITRGKLQLREQRLRLSAVLEGAVEAVRPLLESRRHRLDVSLPRRAPWLRADPTRLSQVFVNLLTNAARYTPVGGRIALSAAREGDRVRVSVRDSGVGIAREHLESVFDPFTQVAPALDREPAGLGIGLALVRSLVELHGGSVEARSAGRQRGSEFIVRLPISKRGRERPSAERGAPRAEETDGLRILIVDDNADAAHGLDRLLHRYGHATRVAADGPQALVEAEAYRPEVVLLDIGLPGMDGYEVARRIRRAPWGSGIVLVAQTGWGMEQDRRRAVEAGFDQHFTKPVDVRALTRLLARIARERHGA